MRRGFTLMEIMVVVVIIAVLSEVAVPMVTSITDESRRSATKGKMKALKEGIMAFRMDIGRLPHWGSVYNAISIDKAGTFFMNSMVGEDCPLIRDDFDVPISGFGRCGITSKQKFRNRWKGPYMTTDPADFFLDGWDGEIYYVYYNRAVWLHSYGADGESASPTCFLPNNNTDDIVMSITKVKF